MRVTVRMENAVTSAILCASDRAISPHNAAGIMLGAWFDLKSALEGATDPGPAMVSDFFCGRLQTAITKAIFSDKGNQS